MFLRNCRILLSLSIYVLSITFAYSIPIPFKLVDKNGQTYEVILEINENLPADEMQKLALQLVKNEGASNIQSIERIHQPQLPPNSVNMLEDSTLSDDELSPYQAEQQVNNGLYAIFVFFGIAAIVPISILTAMLSH